MNSMKYKSSAIAVVLALTSAFSGSTVAANNSTNLLVPPPPPPGLDCRYEIGHYVSEVVIFQNGQNYSHSYEFSWGGLIVASGAGPFPFKIPVIGVDGKEYKRSVLKDSYMYDDTIDGQYVDNAYEYRYQICQL